MTKTVNERLRDDALRHALQSGRYGRGLAKKIVALLNEMDEELVETIERRLGRDIDRGPATTRRLEEMLEAVRSINDRVYKRLADGLEVELTELAAYEMGRVATAMTTAVPASVSVTAVTPTPAMLRTLVTTSAIDGFVLKSWTDGMSSKRLERIEKVCRVSIASGETIDQIVRKIRGTKAKNFKDGILQISRNSAETMAITAVSTISNEARDVVYRENARLLKGVQWVSTLDSRTSEVCQARDGRVYEIDKPRPIPPAHPRCRSVLIPVTKYQPEHRASMNGQVAGNVKFGDWLKSQPLEVVEEVMGTKRANLFLDGRLSFEEFFKADDTYYTLEELKRKL